MKSLAIIPARGGSKRIPRKNLKNFLGKPIIAYSIEAALGSGCFDEVMVSTDDAEIAKVALHYGAKVPFIRSAKNADDFATTADVIIEVLNWYIKNGPCDFDSFCCIYPTAPFITTTRLKEASHVLAETGATSVVPVTAFSYPIYRSLIIENGKLSFKWPRYKSVRSQDLQPAYHDCGQFYFVRATAFLKEKSLFTLDSVPLVISEKEVQDIDNEEDWMIAEMKYLFGQKKIH